MKIDQNTIDTMDAAGIGFWASVRRPGGYMSLILKPNEVAAFIEDPVRTAARHFGASEEQYLDWVKTDGTPRCGAKTKSGKRCKNIVSGIGQQSFEEWLQSDGGFCAVHGGETSDEARKRD